MAAPERPLRSCAGCDAQDQDPRHVIGIVNNGRRKPESWHFDCHAVRGCPSCAEQLSMAGGLRGPDLLRYLAVQRGEIDG